MEKGIMNGYFEEIELYSQGICLYREHIRSEILSRIKGIEDIGKYIDTLNDKEKYKFDFTVLSKLYKYLANNKINHHYNINISPTTIIQPDFISDITLILSSSNSIHKNISFEITESGRQLTKEEICILNKNLNYLKKYFIRIGLDDFPTGNTIYLIHSIDSIDFIKIDKSYVQQCLYGVINLEQFILDIRRLLNFIDSLVYGVEIVMEGVENEQLFQIVTENFGDRVSYLQGYFHSKPTPMLQPEYLSKLN